MRKIDLVRLLMAALMAVSAAFSFAAEDPVRSAGRPFYTIYISSLDRVQEACRTVFESVQRTDLSESMVDRLKSYRNFSGIDPARPAGVMTTWDDATPAEVVFLPVDDIEELLKTATFDVVGFHQVASDRYEIERPGSPYHVVVRGGYAFLADQITTILSLQVTPEQLTRGLRDRYDAGIVFDLNQIPLRTRISYSESLRQQVEPWLQAQDDEEVESARLRRTVGRLALSLIERFLRDTDSVSIGARLEPDTRRFRFEIVVEFAKKSDSALEIDRWKSVRSHFAAMLSSDVPIGLALNLPLGGLAKTILGHEGDSSDKFESLEGGIQIVGEAIGHLSIIAALRGTDASQINDAIPDLLLRLEKSGKFLAVNESFEIQRGVVLHSVIPQSMPALLSKVVGNDVEIVIGQGKQAVWVGVGQNDKLVQQMRDAIDRVEDDTVDPSRVALARARFQARKLPELALSELLIPNVDRETSRQAFAEGEDAFSLNLEPTENGIRLRIEAEEGFVRLFGRDWIKQIELNKGDP